MNRFIIGTGIVIVFTAIMQLTNAQAISYTQSLYVTIFCLPVILGGAVMAIFGLRAMIRDGNFKELFIMAYGMWMKFSRFVNAGSAKPSKTRLRHR